MNVNTNFYNYQNAAPLFQNLGAGFTMVDPAQSLKSLTGALKGNASASPGTGSYGAVDQTMREYILGMKDGSAALKTAANALMGRGASPYGKSTMASSDKAAVEVTSSSSRQSAEMRVQVEQLATGQVNQGAAQNRTDSAALSGYQQFSINYNGKEHQFSFTADAKDTNQSIQQKMADAINSRGIGLRAQVSDQGNGQSALKVETAKTGAEQSFTVKDVSGSAAAHSGIGQVQTAGQDALYRVNGGEQRSSASNSVDLGNGVQASLKAVTDKEVTLTPQADTAPVRDMLQSLVRSFNGLLANVDDSAAASGTVGGNRLKNELTSIAKTYASSLGKVGISLNSKGYLSVDEAKMEKAVENGSLESFMTSGSFTGSYGFANKLGAAAQNIGRSPTAYLAGVYPNAVEADAKSSASSSQGLGMDYRQWASTNALNQIGVMFNFLI